MPQWALGRLLDLAVDLAGMNRDMKLPVARKKYCSDGGGSWNVKQGVCPNPQSVTVQMIYNFISGGAGINVLAEMRARSDRLSTWESAADLSPLWTPAGF